MSPMELSYAKEYIRSMAEGIDPNTGELFDEGHICNQVETVRVLYTILRELEQTAKPSVKKEHPNRPNAGAPWSEEEDEQLKQEFWDEKTIREMCVSHGRSRGAITSRLKKLGMIDN